MDSMVHVQKMTARFFVTLLVLVLEALLYVFGYIQFNRDVLSDTSFITSVDGVTLDVCIAACGVRTSCNSVTYRRTLGSCRLYSTTDNDVTIRKGVLYSQRLSWTKELIPAFPFCNVSCAEFQSCGHVGGVKCSATECPSPKTVDNSVIHGNLRDRGAKTHYACMEGYVAYNGSSMITCRSDGQWDSTSLVCAIPGFNRSHFGYFVSYSYGTTTYTYVSRRACMSHCRNDTRDCAALSYFSENGTCILNGRTSPLAEAPGWEVLVKIFPVVLHAGPNGTNTLSYLDAVEYCTTLGTSIASRDDMNMARNMGYTADWEDCGWILDETTVYVTPWAVLSCYRGGYWGGGRSDVFCKNAQYVH